MTETCATAESSSLSKLLDNIAAVSSNPLKLARRAEIQGRQYEEKYESSFQIEDFDAAIKSYQKALDLTPKDHTERVSRAVNIGVMHGLRYGSAGALHDFEVAKQRFLDALGSTSPNTYKRSTRLQQLGILYVARFSWTNATNDFDTAFNYLKEVLELTPTDDTRPIDDARQITPCMHLASLHRARIDQNWRFTLYMRSQFLQDLNTEIEMLQKILGIISEEAPMWLQFVTSLGNAYYDRWTHNQAATDLDTAEALLLGAYRAIPKESQRIKILGDLGKACYGQFLINKDVKKLDDAIEMLQEASSLSSQDPHFQTKLFRELGNALVDRYRHKALPEDLEAARQSLDTALYAIPKDSRNRLDYLNDAGKVYQESYFNSGLAADFTVALDRFQEALNIILDDHMKPEQMQLLALLYSDKYERTGDFNALKIQISYHKKALSLSLDDHVGRADYLDSLGNAYGDHYRETGSLQDLETCIQELQAALDITPQDHFYKQRRTRNLGLAYSDRYRYVGALDDLEYAIKLLQTAINLTSNDMERARTFQNLGIMHEMRHERLKELEDLKTALKCHRQAVDLTSQSNIERPERLQSLGGCYALMYRNSDMGDDIKSAIQNIQEALELTREDDPRFVDRLRNKAIAYYYRFEQGTGAPGVPYTEDLGVAIQNYQAVVDLTSHSHSQRADRLYELGAAYQVRYGLLGDAADLQAADKHLREALLSTSSRTIGRLRAGRDLFTGFAKRQDWIAAYEVATQVMALIPSLTPWFLESSDRQYWVDEIVDLASNAAAIALKAEKAVYIAIQLLETGRGIVSRSMGEMRTDISDLKHSNPDLAKQFDHLRNLLDSAKVKRQDQQRYDIGKQLDDIIDRIRALPGFEQFLLPPSEDSLKAAAADGCIVLLNASKYGCHALIIRNELIHAVELPLLQYETIQERALSLRDIQIELLEWLWITVAEPVLDAIGYTALPTGKWPHLWWIPTGPLAKLPIHAGGEHLSLDSSNSVMDRAISSYASSIRAIISSRQSSVSSNHIREDHTMVLVGMHETPNLSPLLFVSEEVETLAKLGPAMQLQVRRPIPNRQEVLSAMNDCKIFHFAGHGHTDPQNPVQSALILDDGTLTVESLFETKLQQNRPFLAYLSACGTGQIENQGLIDEGLHIIGACQLAGFQHVIGTLWKVNDQSCVAIATETYKWMQKEQMSHQSVSEGLHHACRRLRSKWYHEQTNRGLAMSKISAGKDGNEVLENRGDLPKRETRAIRDIVPLDDIPMHWVPYVHFGI